MMTDTATMDQGRETTAAERHAPDRAAAGIVWDALDRYHRGATNAIKEAELARRLGIHVRVLQETIEFLIVHDGRPVAALCRPPYGVFVAETVQEKNEYGRQLHHRIVSLARRMRAFVHAPRVRIETQTELFATEGTEGTEKGGSSGPS